jgi:hypothetical protein
MNSFNFNLIVLTSSVLFVMSLFRGWLGIINIIPFILLSLILIALSFIKIKHKSYQKTLSLMTFIIIFFNFILGYVNLIFLLDSISMNYNISNLNFSVIVFFINSIFGIGRLLIFAFVFLLLCATCLFLERRKRVIIGINYQKNAFFVIILIIMSLLILNFQFMGQIYNPYLNIVSGRGYSEKISLNIQDYPADSFSEYHNDNFDNYNLRNKKYKYAFVFVMEQTSLDDFYREKALIENENFFDRVKNKTHFFNNYYTSNQDSRTSIWEMFSSFFLPFECYIDSWQSNYGYVLDTNNLIDFLNKNGIWSYSVSSIGGGSLILGAYPFVDFINLENYEADSEGYLCSTEFSYQEGCEDFAIIDKFKEHVLARKKMSLFYFQELIFGHGEKYMSISGKQRVEYYNDYFNEFYSFLEEENIADDSLIVIVSDHGPKGGGKRIVSDFNIPFMVISDDIESENIDTYYSHFSFKDIFLSYYLELDLPPQEDFIYIVGQSGRNRRGYVDIKNNCSVLGFLGGNYIYVEDVNSGDNCSVSDDIGKLLSYQNYVKKLSIENHTYVYIP